MEDGDLAYSGCAIPGVEDYSAEKGRSFARGLVSRAASRESKPDKPISVVPYFKILRNRLGLVDGFECGVKGEF